MNQDENKQLAIETKEAFEVCRYYVEASMLKFRLPGYKGRLKVVARIMAYFDTTVRSVKEQSKIKPVPNANGLRKELAALVLGVVADCDNAKLLKVEAATTIAGLILEYGFKTFGEYFKFFQQPLNPSPSLN